MKVRWPALVTFLATATAAVGQAAPEPPWWAAVQSYHFPHLYAVDFEDFLPQLQSSSAEYVLIDFYAPWCPHCQHFAPDYERLALAVQRFDATQAGEKASILSGSMDCVRFASTCMQWGVSGFPTLMFGKRATWITKAQEAHPIVDDPSAQVNTQYTDDPSQPPADRPKPFFNPAAITVVPMDGTAQGVVNWIKEKTALTGNVIDLDMSKISKKEIAALLRQSQESAAKPVSTAESPGGVSTAAFTPQHVAVSEKVGIWDMQLATGLFLRDIVQGHTFQDKFKVDPMRDTFIDLVGLLAGRFPEAKAGQSVCRDSFAGLQNQLKSNWEGMTQQVQTNMDDVDNGVKLFAINPDFLEGQWKMCNTDWSTFKAGWKECRGTWPGKRGYTCGLWNMFHQLAAQTTDENALSDLQTVRSAIGHFFGCVECRDHFLQVPVVEANIQTRRDAQLWWWNAHNVVNRRVGKLEIMYDDGDPGFIKAQYPTKAECPKCRTLSSHPSRGQKLRGQSTLAADKAQAADEAAQSGQPIVAVEAAQAADRQAKIEAVKAGLAPKEEVAVETVTITEAVEREHWDLEQVGIYLDRRYGTSQPAS